ncbi:MAG: FMN-binding protein [Gemmatimonadetes bacterium]|nr:FMN-binding protein [Gemmatimonadota bacterium]NIR77392.1 FMN-binding protein [Gemmatimonadota bacterium]NIT85902.1 FMN-binding protein [Gemmatimonadota bacterium]NIU29728.1 FMN-binding protein [Gemmatimonadota bacterium]NIU34769.1 FMN-binding protein [Gemmatimonadota bacterium]
MTRRAPIRPGLLVGFVAVTLAGSGAADAQMLMTQDEALRLAFPEPARIERRTAYLEEATLDSVRALAGEGVRVERSVIPHYLGLRDGEPLGAAYFDVHRVRTLPEVMMVVVSPAGRVQRLEIVKFQEPPEYRAPEAWIEQIVGRELSPGLSLRGEVINITGATLTARAVTDAARRVLAYHALIRPFGPETGAP